MNKIYKIVWNKALAQMVVVSEHAKTAGKGSTTVGTDKSTSQGETFSNATLIFKSLVWSIALVSGTAFANVANNALPTGAIITQGSANITQNNNTLNINQNSQNLSTNWNTFNIGKDATVNFNQPNQSSIAVNRVLDNNASQIMGKLNANGQIFLLNPNGVIFSKTAQVNVGGIVASTLNMSDSDIAQGKFTLKNQGNAGSVENYGSIIANGGVVALIAPTVKNQGSIQANNGTVHLTAADQVTLQLQDGSLTEYQIELGTLQGLVDNGGAIQADNGAVYLTAQGKNSLSKAVVNHSGIIEANRLSKNAKGEIILLGDMQTGITTVSGTLKAEGKNGQDGGFIETSAANIQIADSTQVSTLSDGGKTGTWLIDPTDFNIAATGGDMTGAFVSSTLNSGHLAISSGAGTTGTAGNINVNDNITWTSGNSLTLNAKNDININKNITATNGKLNLEYGQDAANTAANYYLNNGARVNLKAGQNFSTKKGTDAPINYTVITALGAQGSTTSEDLQGIRGGLAGNYVLGADIDATATSGWNNGAGFNPIGTFTGKFDGLNHTISNLTINRPNQYFVGLFGCANGASIQNIGMLGGSITGGDNTGGLVGYNNSGIIRNVYATGTVTGQFVVGGLVGQNGDNSRIENAYATADVKGVSNVGGLVGTNYSNGATYGVPVIKNSYATGNVTRIGSSTNGSFGGLVGQNRTGTIENSYATGLVTAIGVSGVGGLAGASINGDATLNPNLITNSHWDSGSTGQVNAVGYGSGTNITNIAANRYNHTAYSNLGTWSQLGTTGVWVAKQGGVEKWVMIEG